MTDNINPRDAHRVDALLRRCEAIDAAVGSMEASAYQKAEKRIALAEVEKILGAYDQPKPGIRSARRAEVRELSAKADRLWPERRFARYMRGDANAYDVVETRDQGIASGAAGGFLVPQTFVENLVVRLRAYTPALDMFNVWHTSAGATTTFLPTLDDTSNTAAITGENTSVAELDVVLASTRSIPTFLYAGGTLKASVQLVRDSAWPVEDIVTDAMAVRIGRVFGTHVANGDGNGKPKGFLQESGLTTVSEATGHTNSITYNGLVTAIHALDPAYRSGASWAMNDTTLQAVRQLADSQARPLFLDGDEKTMTLLGFPVNIVPDMTAFGSLTAGTISAGFGNWQRFGTVRVAADGVSVTVLRERYMDQLEVGYIGHARLGFSVTDVNAAAFLKTSAS